MPGERPPTAVFPGSFDPLTVAHLAIVDAVREQCDVDRVEVVISRVALDKEGRAHASVDDRLTALRAHAARRPWLDARATDVQLLADIAVDHHVLVVGADKWHQLQDPRFYGSIDARDEALARLPRLAIVPRAEVTIPTWVDAHLLDLPDEFRHVSSTAVRRGRDEWRA